ncbi:MAG: hypothetical protein K6A69_01920, partial [Lachnospiraceae bacterium]|nr:hypothetical protein [Lachnospiraceae bacterium]
MNDLFMILGEDLFSYFLIAIIYWCFNKRVGVLMAFHMSISSCILEFVPKLEPAWAFFIALLIIFPLYLILEFADKGYDRDRFLFYPGIVLYVYLFVTGEGSAYAAGSIGMLLGWYLERKTIQYLPVRSDKDRTLFVIRRFVPGALAILVFKEYVMRKAEAIIPEQLLPGVTGFAIMFFIIYLYPLLFDALAKRKYLSPSEKVYRAVVVFAAALIVVITLAGALNDGAEMYGEMLGIKREDAMEEADAFYIRRSRLFSEAGVWKKTGDLNYIPEGKELPVIAADGGYSKAADYGSLDAIKAAYDIGADAIYLPISATKDGVFVMR